MKKVQVTLAEYDVPENLEVEYLLLAEMIHIPICIRDVRKIVSEVMFSSENSRKVFHVITSKFDTAQQIDLSTIWMASDKKFFKDNILHLSTQVTSLTGAVEHAEIVKELYLKRLAYFSSLEMLQLIKDGNNSTNLLSHSKKLENNITNSLKTKGTETLSEAMNNLMEDVQSGNLIRVPTNITWLDYYTYGGFGNGDLVIIAARPSVGKTAVELQIAHSQAKQGTDVALFSLEMTNKALAKRVLLSTGRVKPLEFYRNTDWNRMEEAIALGETEHLHMVEDCVTLEEIVAKIDSLHREGKCKIAYIDYLQLMKLTRPSRSLIQDIGTITGELKRLAKRLNIPIVLLSQLSRAVAKEDRPPRLDDLRDSGSIEQDADIVVMLSTPKDYSPERETYPKIEMWLRKNRESKKDVSVILTGSETYTNFQEDNG